MSSTSVAFDIIARDKASKTFGRVGSAAASSSSKAEKFGAALLKTGTAFAAVTAAAGIFIVKAGVGYVDSLNKIQALSGANDKTMAGVAKRLESNAGLYAKMGQSTGDAASGVVELVKAGQTLSQAMQSVYGTMTLAKAGELSVADASNLTANALNTFHLKASKAADVANYLANAANISSADVADIGDSFRYVAPVAAAAGVSIKQTNAILAELANAGIKASSAGTSLRTFLLNLQAPATAAANLMDDLGIKIYNAAGKMKPIGDVIQILQDKLKGLSEQDRNVALKTIFGKTGIAGATTILNEGVKGLDKYTQGVSRAGAASKLAEAKSQGLAGSFAILKSGAESGAQSIYRQFSPIADKVLRPLATKFADFAGNLGPELQKGTAKIAGVLDKLNITGIGKGLAVQARDWAVPVIAGFNDGLDSGDWSGLGESLGNGLVKAAGALGDLSDKLGGILEKIDWVGIGIDMGKQAPSLFIGLAAGILNFDLMGLLKGLGKHWQDVLIAILAIAFTPGRIVGKVGELLAHIPFVGKLLEWGLLSFKKFSDGLVKQVFRALGFMGKAFLSGFRKVFPEVGARFTEHLLLFPLRLQLIGLKIAEKGLEMMRGLGRSIVRGTGAVISKIGEVIARMLKPWADANSWLIQKGASFIGGLAKGISGRVGGLISEVVGIGRNIVAGIASGIRDSAGSILSAIKNYVTDKIPGWAKKFLGISSPSKVMREVGKWIPRGLAAGIIDGGMSVKTALDRVLNYVSQTRDKLKSILSAKASFAAGFQAFTSSLFATDLSNTSTDVSGNEVSTPASVGDILAYQQAQRDKARGLKADVRRLHHLGLSNALIKQLQASGESGMAQIHTLAGGTKQDIHRLNSLNAQTQSTLHSAGDILGGPLFNREIRQRRNNEDLAERIAKKLHAALQKEKKDETLVIRDVNGQWIIKAIKKEKRVKGPQNAP